MKVFFGGKLPFMLILGSIAFNVVDGNPLHIKNGQGVSGGGALRNISAQGENQLKRLRRSVHKPYEPCFRHFFVYNQPPTGFRVNLNEIRYICQQIGGSHDVFYATMFDEHLGIAVYAGYKLDRQTINFDQAHRWKGWSREPGILTQGSDAIYKDQWLQKGHLVPAQTYSSSKERLISTYKYTNAVPQVMAFNVGQWAQFERRIRDYARFICVPNNGVLFLLTGTSFGKVLSGSWKVVKWHQLGPISIPNSMWTAGCCVYTNDRAESFAVIGNNDANQLFTRQITLDDLQNILTTDVTQTRLGGPDVNLFPGLENCVNNNLQQRL